MWRGCLARGLDSEKEHGRDARATQMDYTHVIVKPLVTEKSTHQQTTRNTYAFEVNPAANKHQIKLAVEKLYNVKVTDVRTMTRRGKPRRTKYKLTTSSAWKRAVVALAPESQIDLF
jgi:large subunit ribosomal protein L23